MADDIKYEIDNLKREISKAIDMLYNLTSSLNDLRKEDLKNLRYALEEMKKDVKDIKSSQKQ